MLRLTSRRTQTRKLVSLSLSFFLFFCLLPVIPSQPATAKAVIPKVDTTDDQSPQSPQIPVIAPGSAYRQTNFISDVPGLAPVLDPLLVNPWGISLTASSPFWVANNGTSTTQLIRGDVSGSPVVLNANPQTVTIPGGLPTGTVANPVATEFVLPGPCASAPCGANFLFASITGNITGWDPNAPAAGSTTAVIAASHPGHVYTGLAYANNGSANFLYAADFANGTIDVFNTSFALQPAASFPFADPTIPTTAGNTYHPFNIQAIGGSLYVAYAKVGTDGRDEEGVGNGFVRRFNANGVRDLTFGINNGALNSPWGVTLAPASFGIFGGALLVGNFGEGNPSIHAYNPTTGAFLGTLQDESGNGIEIDELWDLKFGNGGSGGDVNTLYFAAGIGEEQHGLFGKLNPTTASATSLIQFSSDEFAISEGSGHIDITVTRAGDASGTATVNYNTFDFAAEPLPTPTPSPTPTPAPDINANQKSDYEIALGTLTFAPGETSKTFRLLLVDDTFDEADEIINLQLSNPTGAGVGLGSPNTAEVSILDNDTGAPTTNPIDDTTFFVRQHYLDFLNREPDPAGLAFWTNEISSCGMDAACIEAKRISVSGAFFLSIEFQTTGYLAYLTHRVAFGANATGGSPAPVLYGNFMRDVQALQKGFIFGQPGADAVLDANKVAYYNEFVTRPEFVAKYPSTLTNEQYVDNLLASAGFSPSQVRLFVVSLTNSQEVPPAVPTTTTGAARPASSGTARFQFNDAQTALTFSATISNIDVSGSATADTNDNLTAAHIHAGPSVAPGVNGPVVWGFFGAPFNDNNPNDQVFFATPGVGGFFSGKWDAPEGNGTTLAAQLSNLREGRAYINFHTRQFGGGEIRGNFPAADTFRNSLVASLNAATDTRATILRKISEAEELKLREVNAAFVTMEYFGYLRRDPDTAGFNFWLNKLNTFNGDFIAAEMVKAFISSSEYRQRFGPS
ncbi:MAG TPA: TIGR03118 family protein [Pyrinomonadaceae bacterium]|nr:TIGR03118 family protein [Pyrinomonadaceae bacterium]